MKAKITILPKSNNPLKGMLTLELENKIHTSIRMDHVKVPKEKFNIGQIVDVSFEDNGHIREVTIEQAKI
jgi:hypothetical protein